jgi:hypothetical protein
MNQMSTNAPIVIERMNLSLAWADAFLAAAETRSRDLRPFVITIGGFAPPLPPEDIAVREAVDDHLATLGKNSVDISGMTIFPYKPWVRRSMPGCADFSKFCVSQLLPRLKKLDNRNQKGTYFGRMMAYTGTRRTGPRTVNQLEFIINLLRKPRCQRESALQIACFDPAKDHTGQPVRGFPCLQQLGISYDADRNFAVNAYYPTQYIFDRAYGNYLGLCHLGHFLAKETGLTFVRLTCFVGKPELGEVRKRDLKSLIELAKAATSRNALDQTFQKGALRDISRISA